MTELELNYLAKKIAEQFENSTEVELKEEDFNPVIKKLDWILLILMVFNIAFAIVFFYLFTIISHLNLLQ